MATEKELTEKDLELISKSLDEDLSEFERRRLNTTVLSKQDGEKAWVRYHAVSAIMNKQFPANIDRDFSQQVMQAIQEDNQQEYTEKKSFPAIKSVGSYIKQVTGLAVAASVAAFSVVTYQYFNQPISPESDSLIISSKKSSENMTPASAVALSKSQQVEFSPATQQLNERQHPNVEENVYYQELNPYIQGHAGYGSQRIISPYVEMIELKDVQE